MRGGAGGGAAVGRRLGPRSAGRLPAGRAAALLPGLPTLSRPLPIRPPPRHTPAPAQEIARLEARRRHQQRLLGQIDERKGARAAEREELLAEGRRIRERLDEERALLAAVKQLKLRELEAAGVERYSAPLKKMAPGAPAGLRAAK